MADSLILMVLALVVFGPRRLPEIGRQIGKLMYEFRKASNDFKFQMEEELRAAEEADRRKKEDEERQRQLAGNPPAQIEASASTQGEASESTETAAPVLEPAATDSRDPYAYTYGDLTEESIRIQPPSTGEPVPADSPTAAIAAEEPPAPAATEAVTEQVNQEIAADAKNTGVEDSDKTIEPATHNG